MRRYYGAAALVSVLGLIALAVALLLAGDDETRPDSDVASSSTTSTSFPYDFVEAAREVDVETLAGAKFASLTLVTAEGLESYLLPADSAGFAMLTDALREAEQGKRQPAPGEPAPGAAAGSTIPADSSAVVPGVTASTLTYVMDDRSTYTLILDDGADVLYRGTQEWHLRTDLGALIATAAETTP